MPLNSQNMRILAKARISSELSPALKRASLAATHASRKLVANILPLIDRAEEFQKAHSRIKRLVSAFAKGPLNGWPKFAVPLKTLAEHGWFISLSHTPIAWIYPLARLFETGQYRKANCRLRIHFHQQLDQIESRLIRDFPKRREILGKAFRAHHAKDHELCIPVFLSQADGIAREIFKIHDIPRFSIYSRKDRQREKLKAFVESIIFSDFQREILEVVACETPLNDSSAGLPFPRRYLNRHEVLHGISTDYASATNSYRAISWLQYVASFKHEKEAADSRKARLRSQ